ncbi:hypothetical protein N7526_004307 [Penicillium atrosanguineum]|nr:hypothetical protein N7526_004307 [Penicillium atrosanguineum]
MARVVRRAASALARRAPSRAVQRRARKHKVIMESVTQEKKKLRTVISFEARAPSGYTFIPAGNPLLTTTCKERCRKEGLQIHAVSTTPHANTHNLSQHVHRIGFHFPSTVVATACSELGLYLTSAGKAVPFHNLGNLDHPPQADSEVSQLTINTEARDAIKDLFPNVPQSDLFQIIKTAFQKGQQKVGTAPGLPLARRAQLAVVAHIRHVYTDYDRLLKQKSFHEARAAVEQTTLIKVIQWRGDDENGQTVLEDVFREVIVISDDEDSETEEEMTSATNTRDPSVEYLSNNDRFQDVQTQPVNIGIPSNEDLAKELSEEAPPGFRFVARVPAKKTIDRRGFSRYQAWNRALHRFRAEAQGTEQAHLGEAPPEQQSPRNAKRCADAQELSDPVMRRDIAPKSVGFVSRADPGPIQANRPAQQMSGVPSADNPSGKNHVGTQERQLPLESQRAFSQYGSGGRPLSLTAQEPFDIRPMERNPRPSGNVIYPQNNSHAEAGSNLRTERFHIPSKVRANAPVFVSGPKELQPISETQVGSRPELPLSYLSSSGPIPQDHALPSIETPWPLEKRLVEGRLEQMTKRMSLRSVTPVHHLQGDSSHHGNAGPPDSPDDPNVKRRRIAHYARRPDSRPDTWNTRPNGVPVSQGLSPRGQYRREEIVPEYCSQDPPYFRRYYFPPAEQPLVAGYPPERIPVALAAAQVSQDGRPPMERMRIIDPHQQASTHRPPPAFSGPNGSYAGGDRTTRVAQEISRPETRPAYYSDRSPRMDRARPSTLEEPYAPIWKPYTDRDHLFHEVPPGGKQYADGFVRHVDIREARPVEYLIQRPRPQPTHPGENLTQPAKMRMPDHYDTMRLSQARASSEQYQPPSPRVVAQKSHDQLYRRPEVVPGSHKPHGSPRQRRPGSGLSTTRRVHAPRSVQMAEQNRPIYVQRVESQPPQQTVPDGRHVVIVD